MKTDDEEICCKAQRLAIAGYAASRVRAGADANSVRRVARVDSDGNVVGYTTLAEVQAKILARAAIEFSVQPGRRAERLICAHCGAPFRPNKAAKKQPRYCLDCAEPRCSDCGKRVSAATGFKWRAKGPGYKGACGTCSREAADLRRCMSCAICGVRLSPHAGHSSRARGRNGKPPQCRKCQFAGLKASQGSAAPLIACVDCGRATTYRKTPSRGDRPRRCVPCSRRANGAKMREIWAARRASGEAYAALCKRGHPLHGENLRFASGRRRCRACERMRDRNSRAIQDRETKT